MEEERPSHRVIIPKEDEAKFGCHALTEAQIDDAIRFLKSSEKLRLWPSSVLLKSDKSEREGEELKNAKKVYRDSFKKYAVIKDVLYRTERRAKTGAEEQKKSENQVLLTVISKEKVLDVLHQFHGPSTTGHLGIVITRNKIGERYFWPGYTKDVTLFCSYCTACRRHSTMPKKTANLHPVGIPHKPFTQWGMDLVGPFRTTKAGHEYILVMTEYTTKWPEAFPIPTKEARHVFQALKHIVGRFGCPRTILSDQGREFCNELNNTLCTKLGIKRRVSTAYHPQTNGLTERFNQTLCQMLTKCTEGGKTDWDLDIDLYLMAYRSSKQNSTQRTPFELVYGQMMRLPSELDTPSGGDDGDNVDDVDDISGEFQDRVLVGRRGVPTDAEVAAACELRAELLVELTKVRADARDNAKAAQEKQKEQYAKRHGGVIKQFAVGDMVFVYDKRRDGRLSNKELEFKQRGPFRIVETNVEFNTYKIQSTRSIITRHADYLENARNCQPDETNQKPKTKKRKAPSPSPSPSPTPTTPPPSQSAPSSSPTVMRHEFPQSQSSSSPLHHPGQRHSTPSPTPRSSRPLKQRRRLAMVDQPVIDLRDAPSPPPSPPNLVWLGDVNIDGSDEMISMGLKLSDKELLENSNATLNSKFIEVAQDLLHAHHPHLQGLQPPGLDQTAVGFDRFTGEAIQVLHTRENHWITITTIGRQVLVLDSYFDVTTEGTKEQLVELCANLADNSVLHLKVLRSQHQVNGIDCGLFAIANATELAVNGLVDFTKIFFDPKQLRAHLIRCLEQGRMTAFPKSKSKLRLKRGRSEIIDITLYQRHKRQR